MNGKTTLIAGLGAGALAMYLLDPERGRTRRVQISQKLNRLARKSKEGLDAASRDAQNRLIGLWNDAAAKFTPDDVSDEALTARVRAAMGRKVSHPSAVLISCQDGNVTLSGEILGGEVKGILSCARKVNGVKEVYDELTVHNEPGTVSSLQGKGQTGDRTVRIRSGPALIVGAAGLSLVALGVTRKIATSRGSSALADSEYLTMAEGS